mgnify:CR=1 FL=1
MTLWQIFVLITVITAFMEMFVPSLIFLNISFAALLAAGLAYINVPAIFVTVSFVLFATVSLWFVRPIMMKYFYFDKSENTGMDSKYIGNTAVVVKDVSKNSGRVAIYGEEWEARTTNDDVIPKGSNVKILSNESIVLYVEKI